MILGCKSENTIRLRSSLIWFPIFFFFLLLVIFVQKARVCFRQFISLPRSTCFVYLQRVRWFPVLTMAKKSALFICLGNICRSPIAEAVFLNLIESKNQKDSWTVDSAALGSWHVGNAPDDRAMLTLQKHNIVYSHIVRQIKDDDFNEFDFIFGMDEDNMKKLKRLAPSGSRAKLHLLGEFDPKGERIIRDPYYDSDNRGFEKCYEQCVRSCSAFLDKQ